MNEQEDGVERNPYQPGTAAHTIYSNGLMERERLLGQLHSVESSLKGMGRPVDADIGKKSFSDEDRSGNI